MNIFIYILLSKKTISIEINENETIRSIKNKITKTGNKMKSTYRLEYKGKVLNNKKTVGFYNIISNETLYVAPKGMGLK